MESLRKQPLLTFGMFFVVSSFILYYTNTLSRTVVFSLSILVIAFSCYFIRYKCGIYKRTALFIITIMLGIGLSGLRQLIYHDFQVKNIVSFAESEAKITAVIEEVNYRSNFATTYTVKVTSVDNKKTNFRAILYFNSSNDADKNDIITLTTIFYLPDENQNGFPLRRYYASKNIHITLEAVSDDFDIVGRNKSLKGFFSDLSDNLSAKLRLSLGEDVGDLSSGILLGRKDDISDATRRDFRFLGISHILSVSGLHLTVIVGGFLALSYRLRLKRVLRFIISAALIIFLAFLTGFSSSVVRSGIMMLMVQTANVLGKINNPILSLFFAGTLITVFSPSSVADVGFLLSFLATLGLLTLGSSAYSFIMKTVAKNHRIIRAFGKILASVGVTISAIIFTLPFTYYYFGEISLISPLSNLIFVPLSGILLFLSIGVLLFRIKIIGPLICSAAKVIGNVIIDLASYLTRHTAEPIALNYRFTVFAFIFSFISLIILLVRIKKRNALFILIPFAVWTMVFSICYFSHSKIYADDVNVVAHNYKNNDYIIVNSGGKTLLCDFSDGRRTGINNAASLIPRELHDTSVDALLLTHLHSYHVTSFIELADNNRLGYLIIPYGYDEKTENIVIQLEEAAKIRNIDVMRYSNTGDKITFSDCKISLSGISFIKRSKQPVSFVSVNTGKGVFSYFSASVFESELSHDARNEAEISNAVWYGIHGPIIKSELKDVSSNADVVVSNSEVNELYNTHFNEVNNGTKPFLKFTFR